MQAMQSYSTCSNLDGYENDTNAPFRFQSNHSGRKVAAQCSNIRATSPVKAGNRTHHGLTAVVGISFSSVRHSCETRAALNLCASGVMHRSTDTISLVVQAIGLSTRFRQWEVGSKMPASGIRVVNYGSCPPRVSKAISYPRDFEDWELTEQGTPDFLGDFFCHLLSERKRAWESTEQVLNNQFNNFGSQELN